MHIRITEIEQLKDLHTMTTSEFNKAFEYKFLESSLNFRVFENDDLKVTIRKESDDNFRVTIEYTFDGIDDEHFNADEDYLLNLIDEVDLELQDYNDDQQLEIDLNNMPEVESIEESTYTCKNGYKMKIFVIDFEELCTFDKSKEYDLEDLVKSLRGWFDYRKKNIVLRNRKDAEKVLDFIYA